MADHRDWCIQIVRSLARPNTGSTTQLLYDQPFLESYALLAWLIIEIIGYRERERERERESLDEV
jgi:hypothetical protein